MDATHAGGRTIVDRPYILLSLASLFWAINIVLGRFIAGTVPPITLAQIRWGGAALILLPISWRHIRRDWPTIRANLPILLVLALTGITLYNTMAYYGLNYTQALNALLMQSSGPLLVALMSLILFRDRLTRQQLIGILVSMLGVIVIITRGHPGILFGLGLNRGDAWLVAAMGVYALYTGLLRKRPAIHFLSFLAFTIAAGAIMLIPLFLIEFGSGYRIDPTPAAFGVILYVVIFPSILSYFCFNRGVELIGANRAGQFFHLIPVFGSAIAILFLGERPEWFHGVGYALIICGIVIAQRNWRRARTAS